MGRAPPPRAAPRQAPPPTPAHTGISGPECPPNSGTPRCPWCRPAGAGRLRLGRQGRGRVCSGPAYREPGALRRARVPLLSFFLPLEVLCLSIAPAGKCQLLQNSLAQDNSLSLRDSLFISVSALIKLDHSFKHYPLTTYYVPGIIVNRGCNNNYRLLNGS